jgi:hypothetical protein
VVESDIDGDRLGDSTEDRTDLTLTAVPTRDAIGRLKVAVTIANPGPLRADRPILTATKRLGRWEGACDQNVISANQCYLEPLAVGESRTLSFYDDAPAAQSAGFTLVSEGPDLNGLNNLSLLAFGAAQAFDLSTAPKQHLKDGVKLSVLSALTRRARVTLSFKTHGKTVKIGRVIDTPGLKDVQVTLRPSGAKLRTLKRALARGPVKTQLTVRPYSGQSPVTVKTTLTN